MSTAEVEHFAAQSAAVHSARRVPTSNASAKKTTAIASTRAEDFPEWYQQVIAAADLAENSEIRGCMVIKLWGYALWENVRRTRRHVAERRARHRTNLVRHGPSPQRFVDEPTPPGVEEIRYRSDGRDLKAWYAHPVAERALDRWSPTEWQPEHRRMSTTVRKRYLGLSSCFAPRIPDIRS